jgi:DnaK suppressor protein
LEGVDGLERIARTPHNHRALVGSDDSREPDPAIGRLTRVDAVQAGYVSEALRTQMLAELARIGHALRSIDEGTYGVCRSCGDRRSDARLEAKPDANLCVECASKCER